MKLNDLIKKVEEDIKKIAVSRTSHRSFINKGTPPKSMIFGYRKYQNKYGLSTASKKYPEFYNDLKNLMKAKDPNFKFSTITLNKNFKCQPHKDGNNVGYSYIIGLGDYENGELNVEGKKIDINKKFYKFNGSQKEHWVEDWKNGDRYTIVYYENKTYGGMGYLTHDNDQSGDGLFVREAGVLQPLARKLLESVGNEEIKTLEIIRTPLSSFTKAFLNTISLGQFEKISKKYYDEMFHLSLWINGKYNLEKNEVVYFNTNNPKKSNSQVKEVKNIPAGITIQQLIDNTKKRMGNENFSNYDAEKLNCQNFLINVLDGSDIGDNEDKNFIFQDATKIFKELPEYSKVLGKVSVKLGAIFNRLIYGEGEMNGYGSCGKPIGECMCSHSAGGRRLEQMGEGSCDIPEGMCGGGIVEDYMKKHPDFKSPNLQESGEIIAKDVSRYLSNLKKYYGKGLEQSINANGLIDSREATLIF